MRENKSPCELSTFSKFSYFSQCLVEKVDGHEVVLFRVRVRRNPLKRLPNVFGHLRILSDPYGKC